MKLLLLSNPTFFIEEDKILATLFEDGLDMLHLRKPGSEPVYCERLLTLIPTRYHNRIVANDHFYLKEEFGLAGIHISHHNPNLPNGYKGQKSCTCYDLEDLPRCKKEYDYVILKNVFDSISEPDYRSRYTLEQLKDASRRGLIDRHVMAQGGVSLELLPQVRDLGFGGAVIRGDLWKRFNIHSGMDFKDLLLHFHRLRKASE